MSNPDPYIPLFPSKCCCTHHHTLSPAPSSSWESYWSAERGWPSETCLLGQQKWHGGTCWEMQVLFSFFMLITGTFTYTTCKFIMVTGPQLLWTSQKRNLSLNSPGMEDIMEAILHLIHQNAWWGRPGNMTIILFIYLYKQTQQQKWFLSQKSQCYPLWQPGWTRSKLC